MLLAVSSFGMFVYVLFHSGEFLLPRGSVCDIYTGRRCLVVPGQVSGLIVRKLWLYVAKMHIVFRHSSAVGVADDNKSSSVSTSVQTITNVQRSFLLRNRQARQVHR